MTIQGEELQGLRDRAVIATGTSFTVSDPNLPDNPLVSVNPAFSRVTGYSATEVIGHNCRFLQGPDTAPEHVEALRAALREQRTATVTLLNYRRDGTAFWNEVSLSPVFDDGGALTHFVGVQADVTDRVRAEQERERAYAAEREARAQAERAQARLALLAEASTLLTATLDVDTAMQRLANLAVPALADWCSVELVQDTDPAHRLAVAHVDAEGAELLRQADRIRPRPLVPTSAAAGVLAGGEAVLVAEVDDEYLRQISADDEQLALYRRLETRSAMVLPLRARRQTLGTITLATTTSSGRRLTASDLELAKDLTRRAALAVDNARLYTREHQVVEALQRSLLPTLPSIPGLAVAARYLASSEGSQVGGDWYDVLALPDGVVGVAIGDVMGHDISAAASMGQLRSVLRSYAWEGGRASDVLDRLDQLVQALEMAQLATAVYGRLQLVTGGEAWTLRFAKCGAPPAPAAPLRRHRRVPRGRALRAARRAGGRATVRGDRDPAAGLVAAAVYRRARGASRPCPRRGPRAAAGQGRGQPRGRRPRGPVRGCPRRRRRRPRRRRRDPRPAPRAATTGLTPLTPPARPAAALSGGRRRGHGRRGWGRAVAAGQRQRQAAGHQHGAAGHWAGASSRAGCSNSETRIGSFSPPGRSHCQTIVDLQLVGPGRHGYRRGIKPSGRRTEPLGHGDGPERR